MWVFQLTSKLNSERVWGDSATREENDEGWSVSNPTYSKEVPHYHEDPLFIADEEIVRYLRTVPKVDEKRRRGRLDMQKASEIRELSRNGMSRKRLANKFDVSVSTISNVINYKTWRDD